MGGGGDGGACVRVCVRVWGVRACVCVCVWFARSGGGCTICKD